MTKQERNMLIITTAGFFIGTAEALIYYNLGESKANKNKKFVYKIPPTKELLQTATIVRFTSVLTATFTRGIEQALDPIETNNQVEGFKGNMLPAFDLF